MTGKNIDYIASKHAQTLIRNVSDYRDVMTTSTKILGVLTEDGIYAALLYVFATVKDSIRPEFVYGTLSSLGDVRLLAGSRLAEDYRDKCSKLEKVKKEKSKEDIRRLNNEIHDLQDEILKAISDITNDLNKTLLARLVLERFLTYVRYHAKAKGG